jgi:hypothetical protein
VPLYSVAVTGPRAAHTAPPSREVETTTGPSGRDPPLRIGETSSEVLMLAAILDKVSLGPPSAYRNLTLTPILLKDGPLSSPEPMSLEEALGAGTLRVSEVSAEGHVPELRVENSGETPVLILDGEELVGAK